MKAPRPFDLAQYVRDFTPDLEVKPRQPVFAVGLLSAKGVPFVLVREKAEYDHIGGMLAWLVWRGHDCVGYVGTNLSESTQLARTQRIVSPRMMQTHRSAKVWRSLIVDGTGSGTGGEVLARVPSRGLGIMTRAYIEIIRQLSEHGLALSSNPKARSAEAKALWNRLHAAPGLAIVKRRRGGVSYEYAFMLASAQELEVPGPTREA